jgi:hypothetical protein
MAKRTRGSVRAELVSLTFPSAWKKLNTEPSIGCFQFIWLSSYRKENFLEIDQSEKRIACGTL